MVSESVLFSFFVSGNKFKFKDEKINARNETDQFQQTV